LSTPLAFYDVGELIQTKSDGMCHVRHILGLLGDGSMALCGIGRNVPELVYGNLGRDSLADVWAEHPMLRELRAELDGDYPGVCGNCIHAKRCLTYCVAQNYMDHGRLVAPSWLCFDLEKRGLFPAGRLR
jgi:radical SAM protein with 4Fe4S-binding SPASM domain